MSGNSLMIHYKEQLNKSIKLCYLTENAIKLC